MSTLTLNDALKHAITHHKAGKLSEAEQLYRSILQAEPRHPEANHNLGVIAFQRKTPHSALPHFKTALESDPAQAQFWISYINILIETRQLQTAEQVLAQGKMHIQGTVLAALEQRLQALLHPVEDTPSGSLQHGIDLREQGRYLDAETWLASWLLTHPSDAHAYALYAHTLLLNKKEDMAWDAINKALALQASLPIVQRTLAQLLIKRRQIDKAVQIARAVWQRDQKDPENQLVLAATLLSAGKQDEAYTMLNKLVMHHTSYAEAYFMLAILKRQKGLFPHALSDAEKALALKPHIAEAWLLHSALLSQLGHRDASARSLEKFLTLEPNHIDALTLLAQYKYLVKQYEEARQLLDRALHFHPSHVPALMHLGVLLHNQGHIQEALTTYRKILELQPDTPEVLGYLASILKNEDNLAIAIRELRKARTLKPADSEIYFHLLDALIEDDQLEAAEHLLHEGRHHFKQHQEYLLHSCRIACKRNEWPKAKRYLEQCRTKTPGNPMVFEHFLRALVADNRTQEARTLFTELLQEMRDARTPSDTRTSNDRPMTALLTMGRAGSMFFHSLFDGHPELLTLPGVYFKGWFSSEAWKRFAPESSSTTWREQLVQLILKEFQPLFDANSKQNVIGYPLGYSAWLAKACGFMNMGPDQTQCFTIDRNVFASHLLALLTPLPHVDQKRCFELIHEAYAKTLHGNDVKATPSTQFFYHIHNPNLMELGGFLTHYSNARLLYIVRHPVQNLESRIINIMESDMDMMGTDTDKNLQDKFLLGRWAKSVAAVKDILQQLRSPWYYAHQCRAVRLEDVKQKPQEIMPLIAKWMGIEPHSSLYESSFGGLQYWGPASKVTDPITGFDTKAITRSTGTLFGTRDIIIFETLFWPFSKAFHYSDKDEASFLAQMKTIRPWLDEPLAFEENLYQQLTDKSCALKEMPSYLSLHRLLRETWDILERDGTYHGMLQPLEQSL